RFGGRALLHEVLAQARKLALLAGIVAVFLGGALLWRLGRRRQRSGFLGRGRDRGAGGGGGCLGAREARGRFLGLQAGLCPSKGCPQRLGPRLFHDEVEQLIERNLFILDGEDGRRRLGGRRRHTHAKKLGRGVLQDLRRDRFLQDDIRMRAE